MFWGLSRCRQLCCVFCFVAFAVAVSAFVACFRVYWLVLLLFFFAFVTCVMVYWLGVCLDQLLFLFSSPLSPVFWCTGSCIPCLLARLVLGCCYVYAVSKKKSTKKINIVERNNGTEYNGQSCSGEEKMWSIWS